MSESDEWGVASLSRDDVGLVVIHGVNTPAPRRVYAAALAFSGGTVVIDVTAPNVVPRAVISDAYAAQSWLASVYGQTVADTVTTLAEASDDVPQVHLPVVKDYLSDVVVRLGLGSWLHRRWPAAPGTQLGELDDAVLEIELGGLAWLAEAAFACTDEAARLLAPHGEYLASVATAARIEGRGKRGELTESALTLALRAFVESVPSVSPGYDACDALLSEIESTEVEFRQVVAGDPAWADFLEHVRDQVLEGASRAAPTGTGGARSATRSGFSTVDTQRVPERLVSSREANLRWTLAPVPEAEGLWQLEVRVEAADRVVAPITPLVARAYIDGVPNLFPLAFADGRFTGALPLPADLAVDDVSIVVDAFDHRFVGPARVSPEGQAAVLAELRDVERFIKAIRVDGQPAALAVSEPSAWSFDRPFVAELLAVRKAR